MKANMNECYVVLTHIAYSGLDVPSEFYYGPEAKEEARAAAAEANKLYEKHGSSCKAVVDTLRNAVWDYGSDKYQDGLSAAADSGALYWETSFVG